MSTTTEIERMPESFSLETIQAGVCALAFTLEAERTTNLVEPTLPLIGAASEIFSPKPSVFTGVTFEIGSVKAAPVACENSRAIPRIEKQ